MWENVRGQVVETQAGPLVCADTGLAKRPADQIELVRQPHRGNAHGVLKGIGVRPCVYVNPRTAQFWIIDYRLYAPAGEGKSKLDPVQERLTNVVSQKRLPFRAVLLDTGYAPTALMLSIAQGQKLYYCPLKDTRQVDDSGGPRP